jgi:hypothetical protein
MRNTRHKNADRTYTKFDSTMVMSLLQIPPRKLKIFKTFSGNVENGSPDSVVATVTKLQAGLARNRV